MQFQYVAGRRESGDARGSSLQGLLFRALGVCSVKEVKVGREAGRGGATSHPDTRETKARGVQIQGSYSRHPATEYGPNPFCSF